MLRVLDTRAMAAVEERAARALGTDLEGLMERAGAALANEVATRAPEGLIGVMAGPGNNGGDGWVAARLLHAAGRDVVVWATRGPAELAELARGAAARAVAAGVAWSAPGSAPALDDLAACAVVVDALLGTGVSGPVRAPLSEWVQALGESGARVIAADVPTGVDSDTGAVAGVAVRADATVCLLGLKPGLLLYPGAAHAGEVVLADLDAPPSVFSADAPEVWSAADLASALPVIAPDAHKNSRGRLLVVAGSSAYPGAAILTVRGAQRAGAGYVTLATPEGAVSAAQSHLVSAPVIGMAQATSGTFSSRALPLLLDMARDYDAVVLGPGLTLADGAAALARDFVARVDRPLVVDADGLNALVDATGVLAARERPTIVTPHPGEAARLLGVSSAEVQANRLSCSESLAQLAGGVAVLKGAPTIVSGGGRQAVNTSGGPGLATAGTGDVLAGVVGSLLAQGLQAYDAATLGVWLHGRAGDLAASDRTPHSVAAEDVPRYLSAAFGELLGVW